MDEFYVQMSLPKSWCLTNLVFIPKKVNPAQIKDYRPIAICNVAYTIFSKCLVNRLKPVIKRCISKEQCAFVEKKKLQDNILVISEIVSVIRKSKRKRPFIILKLDLEKAHDRVS
ncbi:hypothetical protein Cni_G01869 [Canna indica]|uniref:Reverse transcriptase domain-containing protein n=1 Tax=Canna indica TaxID=4628 RepID=A0AAQ3JR41_9LILI|nr:hypothetical protein Cni_G01869 [Canna indica]